MKFSVPTNWQDDLVAIFKSPEIDEVYGKLAQDYVGGGRPGYSQFNVSKKKAASHIRKIHESNCKFNYLLNSSCLGGREFTRKGRREIFKLLNWLVEIGVDSVTVSLPYLAQIIKKNFPALDINVSDLAHVDSLRKIEFWELLGVTCITLANTEFNRRFEFIKRIRSKISCQLRLIANNLCLLDCPYQEYHNDWSSHASQTEQKTGNFVIDYCFLSCRYKKILDPESLISSPWIRPEDIDVYEKVGIDNIKLVDRKLPTSELIKIISAYINKKYKGNLIELFPNFCIISCKGKKNFLLRTKYSLSSINTNIKLIGKIKDLVGKPDIYI